MDQPAALAVMGQAIKDPGPFRQALDQTALGQQLQMARDARLALPQRFGNFAHRELALGQQRNQPQARRFAGGAQTIEKLGEGEHRFSSGCIKI